MDKFLRVETRNGKYVAIFKDFIGTFPMDEKSVKLRMKNLQDIKIDVSEEDKALKCIEEKKKDDLNKIGGIDPDKQQYQANNS